MGKIELIAIVFLAAVVMAQANNATNSTSAPSSNMTTPVPTTAEPATTAADAGVLKPLAVFVLACAFLGLVH